MVPSIDNMRVKGLVEMKAKNGKPRGAGRPRTASDPNPIDIHIGNRIRQRRTLLAISQDKLASALGVTFQQIQKYERGTNRVGPSRLVQLSQALDVPTSYFFEGVGNKKLAAPKTSQPLALSDNKATEFEDDPLRRRETLELVRAYYHITDPDARRKVFDLIRALGEGKRPYSKRARTAKPQGEKLPLGKK